MNGYIKSAYENGRLVLLLGAGCSLSSQDQFGQNLLSARDLSKKIAEKVGWDYADEQLSTVYSAAKEVMGEGLYSLLLELYKHCQPSEDYIKLSRYIWPRIYTINIDDALDKALIKYSKQKINIRHRCDKVADQDQLFKSLDYIKLNGSIDRVEAGFIFSPNEYGQASSKPPLWYKELAEDFYRYTFVLIGTKLNEPIFYHQIARYKAETCSSERRSYVITPSASPIEKSNLKTLNLEHISGSLTDFVKWLEDSFPTPVYPIEIAYNRNPALRELFSKETEKEKEKFINIFDDIFFVSRKHFKTANKAAEIERKIRSFYKGFKPEWVDIFDGVPAILTDTEKLYKIVTDSLIENVNLIVLYGPAGSGKTTLLKQVALQINENVDIPCYFLERPTPDFKLLIAELEKLHDSRFCLFFDRLDAHTLEIKDIIESRILNNGLIVGSESQRKWKGEIEDILGQHVAYSLKISLINQKDAQAILDKLEVYGPWTRLGKMSKSERKKELIDRSKRQLLIGLIETTYGAGFEKIIEKEFVEIKDEAEKIFVIIIGLATIHRYYIKHEYVSRALSHLGIAKSVSYFVGKLSGIVSYNNGNLLARHPVYVRHLFSEIIGAAELFPVLKSLLFSYTVYKSPISRNVSKNEMQLFKSLINHKFMKDIFRHEQELIPKIYESFEKDFENDGHFLLQYGLSLRDFNMNAEAHEKLKTALIAFPSSSLIEHALAQQELIMACSQTSKVKAYALLEQSIDRLENLNKYYRSRNAYPIVTLSEGHTCVVRRFESEERAREIAKNYANRISSIDGYRQQLRLNSAWKTLTKYATIGIWMEDKNNLYECLISD